MQKAMNFNDAAIVSVKDSDYRTHFWYSSLNEKSGSLQLFYHI